MASVRDKVIYEMSEDDRECIPYTRIEPHVCLEGAYVSLYPQRAHPTAVSLVDIFRV